MICGIGIDIVRIERIGRAIRRGGPTFLRRVYREEEIACCEKRRYPEAMYAAIFAGKEAILKGFGLGWYSSSWKDMEVRFTFRDKAEAKLYGRIEDLSLMKRVRLIHLDVGFRGEYAFASLLLET
jgi:holo-[acyl-carrier protein] synthase